MRGLATPTIVVVRPEKSFCGVNYWAERLTAELRALGVAVETMTAAEFARAARRPHIDGAICNLEIGSDTRNGDVAHLLRGLLRMRVPKARRLVVIHSAFKPAQLRLSRPMAHLAVAYQWLFYRVLARCATLVALTDAMRDELRRRGLASLTVGGPGMYAAPAGGRPERHDDAFLIGLIGHPYAAKRYDVAVRAFRALDEAERAKARLVVVGGDPTLYPQAAAALHAELAQLPSEQVVVTGLLDEDTMNSWLARLDLAMMPYEQRLSSSDILSRAVGAGVPALVTPLPLFAPWIESGGAIPVTQWPEDATTALKEILTGAQDLRPMRQATEQLAQADSVRSVAERFLAAMRIDWKAAATMERFSVVVPAYNESQTIFNNIKETVETLAAFDYDFEIIVVDDGSNDETYLHAARLLDDHGGRVRVVRYDVNQGKGNALMCGAAYATGEYVVFLDADMDLHPRQLPTFFGIMSATGADVVIGAKRHPLSKVNYPFIRKIYSAVYYVMIRVLFGLPIRDTQTGLKVFKTSVLRNVFPRILVKRFAFDIEVLTNAHRLGYKIVDAPVTLEFKRGEGRVRSSDVKSMLLDTLSVFYRMHILRYYDAIPPRPLSELAAVQESFEVSKP